MGLNASDDDRDQYLGEFLFLCVRPEDFWLPHSLNGFFRPLVEGAHT